MKKTSISTLSLLAVLIVTGSQLQAQTIPFTYTGTSPVAFQMDSSGDLSSIGTYGTGTFSLTGAGTRMFWYPGKAAFRAGYVSGTQWDNTNIGAYSLALGNSTTASGPDSVALGLGSTASGTYATALGWYTTASNTGSFAEGMQANAGGYCAVALGGSTTAIGPYAFAVGEYSTASGSEATAMGYGSAAIGNYSVAMGYGTASGSSSFAMGGSALGASSAAFGGSTASAYDSFAVGLYNTGLSQTGTAASATAWVAADPLFEVGNGTGTGANAKDALVVYKNGNTIVQGTLAAHTGLTCPAQGDLAMGSFTAGTPP